MASLRIPHSPLTDAQWAALRALLPHTSASGRPCDRRAQLDAIFRVAATDGPWRELPPGYGNPASVARCFRRLTHAGLWERLLRTLAASPPGHPLHSLTRIICRATRRAIRLRGLPLIVLARRLKLTRALPAPPWMCPDPDLSEKLFAMPIPRDIPRTRGQLNAVLGYLKSLGKCIGVAGGRRRIPRMIKAIWV
ncbi:transposase [Roseococcus sp. YIM B11640]|uniref:transposase n=1 Tax=Roseococcus sp. YIM B11640 TaxID=3133973 RepID=UPI003C7BBF15